MEDKCAWFVLDWLTDRVMIFFLTVCPFLEEVKIKSFSRRTCVGCVIVVINCFVNFFGDLGWRWHQ